MRTRTEPRITGAVRRVVLASVTTAMVLTTAMCTLPGSSSPSERVDLRQYDVLVENNQPERVTVYWVLADTPLRVAVRVPPYGHRVVTVPDHYRAEELLRVLVCVGIRRPRTRCTVARGWFAFSEHGSVVTVFATTKLAAMVSG